MAAPTPSAPTQAPVPPDPHIAVGAPISDGGSSLLSSPGFMAGILLCCTLLAVLLWVALAVQTRRMNRARAKAQQEAAAMRAAMAVPVIVVMPDDSIEFGAKLYRTASGSMRPVEAIRAAFKAAAHAVPAAQGGQAAAPAPAPAAAGTTPSSSSSSSRAGEPLAGRADP